MQANKATNKILELNTVSLLGIFFLLELIALFLYWFYLQDVLESRFFRLSRDRGMAEIIQYLKFGLIIKMFAMWYRTRPSKLIVAWLILFVVMLIDDSIGIHEWISEMILLKINFPSIAGIRPGDLLEAFGFATVEGTACLYVIVCYRKAPGDLQRYSRQMVLVLIPLVTCGLLLDMVHLPFQDIEQIGEMLSMSLLLFFVHWHHRTRTASDKSTEITLF
jgi:hypothetical protein